VELKARSARSPDSGGRSERASLPDLPNRLETGSGQALVLVRPGSLEMGSASGDPARRANETLRQVVLTRSFYIGTREITNGEFRMFRAGHSSGAAGAFTLDEDAQPVVQVSWDDAARFCNWLSARESLPAAYVERDGRMEASAPLSAGYRLESPEVAQACAEALLARVGPDRLLWGSDWPFAAYENAVRYEDTVARFREWVPDAKTRRIISGETAFRLFFT